MVSAIPTAQGDFRLLTGLWEKAAHHTESVLRAFERLPGDDQKQTALMRAYALLRISDVICERSNLAANAMGASNPRKPMRLSGAGLLSNAKARTGRPSWRQRACQPASLPAPAASFKH